MGTDPFNDVGCLVLPLIDITFCVSMDVKLEFKREGEKVKVSIFLEI